MNYDMIWQIVRYAMLIAGGFATAKGLVSEEQLVALTGAIGTIFTAIWGVAVKWNSTSVPDATANRLDVPTVSPITGAVKP